MSQAHKFKSAIDWRHTTSRLKSIALLFRKTGSEWRKDNVLRLSAAVSFFAVLSLAPLLAIVIRAMIFAHAGRYGDEQILKLTTDLMGAQAASAIKPIIESGTKENTSYLATAISTIVLLFSATSVFIELQNSMNSIWGVEFRKHKKYPAQHAVLAFIRSRLLSLAMVFCLGFLLVFFIFFSGLLAAFHQDIVETTQWPTYLLGRAISGAVQFLLFAAIFKFLPSVQLRWTNVWHGAVIATILFGAGRIGLAIYFKYARISNMYGAAGSFLAILTWIYFSSFSLFFGAEFTKVWTRQYDPSRSHASTS